MSLYARLGLNFDTTKFGDASALSDSAANTLNLVADASGGKLPDWQLNTLSTGPINRSIYLKNPVANAIINISLSLDSIISTAYTVGDTNTANVGNALAIELGRFKSHTDNISGTVAVSNTYFPSLQSAQNIGQLNMMTLAKSDGVQNTSAILGSFTSLFIGPELSANVNQFIFFANEYVSSVKSNTVVDENNVVISSYFFSSLANTEIANMQRYMSNTQNMLTSRRTGDWNFYHNSVQLAQDVAFMQQFNNMGGTMSYLVNNIVGTPALVNNLNS